VSDLVKELNSYDLPAITFIGRSNVGKSSLINAIFGKIARVSNTPGRTQEINIFEFEIVNADKNDPKKTYRGLIFDLPGYGHAEVSKETSKKWNQLIHYFFENMKDNNLLINIQDARHPIQKADCDFLEYLSQFQYQTFIVLNKMDKLKTQKEKNELKTLLPKISKMYKSMRQLYFISAEKKTGLTELTDSMIQHIISMSEI
jgi:GTP-binding protein